MTQGIDTSYANGSPDWNLALDDERVKFVYARACYGQNPADDDGPAFVNAHDACKARGTTFLSYMFWLMGQDGKAQGAHFLDAADGRYGESAVVDVEEGSGVMGWGASVDERVTNLSNTLTVIEAKIGEGIIYTNDDTWSTYFGNTDAFAGHRFIIAQYNGTPGVFDPIRGIKEVVIHQFSDGTGMRPIAGISTPGNNVDRDALVAPDFSAIGRR